MIIKKEVLISYSSKFKKVTNCKKEIIYTIKSTVYTLYMHLSNKYMLPFHLKDVVISRNGEKANWFTLIHQNDEIGFKLNL